MGIKNGSKFYELFQYGLYNKHPKNCNIYVDGEYIRHKGKTLDNTSLPNPEENIARSSFDYLNNIKNIIEQFTKRIITPDKIFVYMDGKRIINKVTRSKDNRFDDSIIRETFIRLCAQYGFTVCRLVDGEAELQMYLTRDKNTDLNIFVTSDSDLFSICYDHIPYIEQNGKTIENQQNFFLKENLKISKNNTNETVKDLNYEYPSDVNVKDSCVWVSCRSIKQNCDLPRKKEIDLIGFDGAKYRIGIETFQFRVFVALCGTDFTDHLFSLSMIEHIIEVIKTNAEFIDFLNSLNDVYEISAAFLYIGVKMGGSCIRNTSKKFTTDFKNFEVILKTYINYIETGKMNVTMPSFGSMFLMLELLFNSMRAGNNTKFKFSDFKLLCEQQSLRTSINNVKNYLEKRSHDYLITHIVMTEQNKNVIDLINSLK